ncbi:MAG: response regulator transcription factor [Lachnospiraceae bacterium]|nr:response regulator transcription factor [Lachnospiraceae bacterium]
MEKIKVLIADDIMILRQGLKAVLEQDEGIEVVALAENGKEAFEKSKVYKPDVVMMDMRMPGYDGEYGIKAIKKELPDVKVLVLTTFDDEETVEKAVLGGADGYLLKEMEDEKVIASVKSVYGGISVFGDGVYKTMMSRMTTGDNVVGGKQSSKTGFFGRNRTGADAYEDTEISFTDRERDVLRLVAEGYDNKEIAAELYLAEGTVRNQVSKLLDKLSLKDRTQLAVYAVKHGLDE